MLFGNDGALRIITQSSGYLARIPSPIARRGVAGPATGRRIRPRAGARPPREFAHPQLGEKFARAKARIAMTPVPPGRESGSSGGLSRARARDSAAPAGLRATACHKPHSGRPLSSAGSRSRSGGTMSVSFPVLRMPSSPEETLQPRRRAAPTARERGVGGTRAPARACGRHGTGAPCPPRDRAFGNRSENAAAIPPG